MDRRKEEQNKTYKQILVPPSKTKSLICNLNVVNSLQKRGHANRKGSIKRVFYLFPM